MGECRYCGRPRPIVIKQVPCQRRTPGRSRRRSKSCAIVVQDRVATARFAGVRRLRPTSGGSSEIAEKRLFGWFAPGSTLGGNLADRHTGTMKTIKGRVLLSVSTGVIMACELGGCAVHMSTERLPHAAPSAWAERIRFQKRVSSMGVERHGYRSTGHEPARRHRSRMDFIKRVSSRGAAPADRWRPSRNHDRHRELVDYLKRLDSQRIEPHR